VPSSKLPNDLQFLTGPVVFDGRELEQVGNGPLLNAVRDCGRYYFANDERALANGDQLPDVGT
jgi:hypothetical protein